VSNPQAIAAVTATLQHLLSQEFNDGGTDVTVKPPDRARGTNTGQQLNVFLYHLEYSGAWRNRGIPGQSLPSEPGVPPLGLNLYYLLTAYGQSDDDLTGHQVLGRAMRLFHDHTVLGRQEIKDALANNDLGEQVERVRITHQPMSLEETSKMWTAFQTNYRLSTAYQVAVVLIESRLPGRTPLPVVTRQISVEPNLLPPFPTIILVEAEHKQPSARLGETLTVTGVHFEGTKPQARVQHRRWANPVELQFAAGPADGMGRFTLDSGVAPPANQKWLAGIYTVAIDVQGPKDSYRRVSNDATFSVAPTMTLPPNTVAIANGVATIAVGVSPPVLPDQRVALLLGDREVQPSARSDDGATLTFQVKDAATGNYFARLRVDGVDSLLVINRDTPAPKLDPTQIVRIQ
jgi:hypothetical protein